MTPEQQVGAYLIACSVFESAVRVQLREEERLRKRQLKKREKKLKTKVS